MSSVKGRLADPGRRQKDNVMNNLRDLFGNVLHIDIIRSVAAQCNYDVQKSSNVLIEMANNVSPPTPKKNNKPKKNSPQQQSPKKKNVPPRHHSPPVFSKPPETNHPQRLQPSSSTGKIVVNKSKKSQDLERVVRNIREGYKVLVILRGLPGSGKSRLAVAITDVTLGPGNNSHHVLSTDDFFVQSRGYLFDPSKLQEAHGWNHQRAFRMMSKGISPVIIDNTNTQMWEMKPYAIMATDYGYIIEILEPDTWWCFNEKELAKRNVHGVGRAKIKDMLDRYDKNVTTEKLLQAFNLTYKFQKPPQFRLIPPIVRNGYNHFGYQQPFDGVTKSKSTSALNRQSSTQSDDCETINLMDFSEEVSDQGLFHTVDDQSTSTNPVDEILMYSEETDSGVLQPDQVGEDSSKKNPFPDIENAWGVDEKALQSWDIVTPISCDFTTPFVPSISEETNDKPETKDVGSNVDAADYWQEGTEIPSGVRVITAIGRDIGLGSPTRTFFSPGKKVTRDQSCNTDDLVESADETARIDDLLDLFPRIPRSHLSDLYNRCNKNFHWTVDLLLEDNHLEVPERNEEEEEEDREEPIVVDDVEETLREPAKVFKRKTISEDSLELKRCIEEKIDINKEHYSQHVLRVKQSKFGTLEEPKPSTSSAVVSDSEMDSEDDSSEQSDDNPKNMIELNLGETFVEQLETMFGGDDGAFPKGFQPVVQMPVALARQIYSFYVESICQQMEAQNHILDRLVKEDEEFARKLQRQEEEEAVERPPPTMMEIMDEQVALSLHKKDVDEWKNMTADNLAAKLTKQKLFKAFPNLDKESLLEIWHAYDYDYNKTVSDLLFSVGPEHINGTKDAISEPPLSNNTLQEMKEAEENCTGVEETEEARPATYYREEANKHLRNREQLYEKAKNYYQRGMTEVAMFYSELAKKETQFYDRANHIAAVAFIEEHSKRLQKFDTLDLHYFYVKEAMANLDIFIDRNINLLKGGTKKGQDLFVITGRGKNSEGGRSKIKPAVMARLKKRKISFVQLNPGLLKIKVLKDSLMTNDLS